MNNHILYSPKGLWCDYDFLINKYFWIKYGINTASQVRRDNLSDVNKILTQYDVMHWLQGQTLKGIYLNAKLLDDHDDDFGIFIGDVNIVRGVIADALSDIGFTLIRDSDCIISFERDYRYIDICLFSKVSPKILGYSYKKFDSYHFDYLEVLTWNGERYYVPNHSQELLIKMYDLRILSFLKVTLGRFKKISKIFSILKLKLKHRIPLLPSKLIIFFSFLLSVFDIRLRKINEESFLNLNIEPDDSFNWKWRKRHLDMVTDGGKCIVVRDIVNHLSREDVKREVESRLVETVLTTPFKIPHNFDMDFWWKGNNFFWYCVKYQYRKNVLPYSEANEYISNNKKPELYTSKYYESLEIMTDKEIKKSLCLSFIEIENNAVISGKHRVFAMIGRLIDGKDFIPFYTLDFNYKDFIK